LKKPTFFVAPDKKEETKQNLYYLGWACFVGWKVGDVINWNFKKEKNNWKSWPLKDALEINKFLLWECFFNLNQTVFFTFLQKQQYRLERI
jgi:hypothetical protein